MKNDTGNAMRKQITVTSNATSAVRSTSQTVAHSVNAFDRLATVNSSEGFCVAPSSLYSELTTSITSEPM